MRRIISIFLVLLSLSAFAEDKHPKTEAYIRQYADIAMAEMHQYKIPASITLAQGILESGNGESELSTKGNNHFGIKCKSTWTGNRMYIDDDEKGECFRVYDHASESYRDHSLFLTQRKWYSPLFELDPKDYKAWAHGLKKCGYATNPKYAEHLITIIERYELDKYDRMPEPEVIAAEEETPADNTAVSETAESLEMVFPEETLFNNIRRIIATSNISPLDVATHYGLSINQVYKYNEMRAGDNFIPGQNVFLQPKKSKGEEETHTVKKGQSMWDISQMHGIQLPQLYAKNQIEGNDQPVAGSVLQLKKKSDAAPQTRTYLDMMREKNAMFYQGVKPITRDDINWTAGLETDPAGFGEGYVKEEIQKIKEANPIPKEEEIVPPPPAPAPVEAPAPTPEPEPKAVTEPEAVEEAEVAEEIPAEPVNPEPPANRYDNLTPPPAAAPIPAAEDVAEEEEKDRLYNELADKVIEAKESGEPIETQVTVTEIPLEPELVQEVTMQESPDDPVVEKPDPQPVYHTIVKGNTMYSLSKQYNTTVDQIREWNKMSGNDIKIGQKIIVGMK